MNDLRLAEIELDLRWASPNAGHVQAHGQGLVIPLPLVFHQRAELLGAERADVHCGSSRVHWTVSRSFGFSSSCLVSCFVADTASSWLSRVLLPVPTCFQPGFG